MRISDWSSDVCSSDLYIAQPEIPLVGYEALQKMISDAQEALRQITPEEINRHEDGEVVFRFKDFTLPFTTEHFLLSFALPNFYFHAATAYDILRMRSEEHTSELQSLMRISYAVFCLKKQKTT